MTVSSLTNKIIYTGDGSTKTFPYTFKIFLEADLIVTQVLISSGAETTLTLNTDYTVAGEGLEAGGSITLLATTAPSTLYQIVIRRVLPLTQLTDYVEGDPLPAETLEECLDRAVMICQQLTEQIDRAIKQGVTSVTSGVVIPALITGYFLRAASSTTLEWAALTSTDYAGTISKGLNSAKSATPSVGDIYVATDTSTLYICYSASVWTSVSGGGPATATRGTFTNATLVAHVLTITHSLGLSAPYSVLLKIFNNSGVEILPDSITGAANSVAVDLTSYGTLSGTWGYIYL